MLLNKKCILAEIICGMFRKIVAVVAGLLVFVFIVSVIESLNAKLYPMPVGIDKANREAIQAYVNSLPKTAFIILLSGYLIGSFFCGLVMRLITKSDDKMPAYLAGIGLTTVGIVNFFSIEHPWWVIITGLLIFIPVTLYGYTLIRKKD